MYLISVFRASFPALVLSVERCRTGKYAWDELNCFRVDINYAVMIFYFPGMLEVS